MSDQPLMPPESSDENLDMLETTLRETARHFVYPPTPDIAAGVRARLRKPPVYGGMRLLRLGLAATIPLALVVVTLAVPETRAFVLEVLRIGAVRIFFVEPTPTLPPTPPPDGMPYASVLDLPGATTLADAQARLGQAILLPTHPSDLGAPDHIYVQRLGGMVVTLAWMEHDDRTQVRLVMQILDSDAVASKYFPWENANQEFTTVNGRHAIWLAEVHQIYFYSADGEVSRLVDKNVLAWEREGLTYRLETDLPLDEARRIAESLEAPGTDAS